MANRALDSFVKLFVDDSELRKSFAGLSPYAARAGASIGETFAAAFKQGSLIGGATGMLAAPIPAAAQFTEALQQLPREHERLARSFHGLRESARIFGTTIASEINPMFGEFVTASAHGARAMGALGAGIGGTLAIVALYASHLKDATDFQVKLNLAAKSFDPAKSGALLQESIAALEKFAQLKREAAAGPGAIGGPPPFRAFFANMQLLFGAGEAELRKNTRDSQAETAKSFAEVTAPRNFLEGEQSRLKMLEQGIGMDRQAAESTDQLRAAVAQLVEVRQKQAATESSLISRERLGIIKELEAALEGVGDNSKAAAEAVAVAQGKLADIDRRALDARKKGELDILQIRRDGLRDVIAMEERQRAHAVEMGRMSIADQAAEMRAATTDPRRTLQERQDAEKKFFDFQRGAAEDYFKFQNQLTGKSNFKEQIDVQRRFLSDLPTAGKPWLDQVGKISDLFVRMREEARGIVSATTGLAESEAGRMQSEADQTAMDARGRALKERQALEKKGFHLGPMPEEFKPTPAQISLSDIPDLLQRVRDRDARALGGARVPIGDLSGAIGRVDLFRTIDKERLSPREAFARFMEDPGQRLARTIGESLGGEHGVTPMLGGMVETGNQVVDVFARIAAAGLEMLGRGSQSGPGPAGRPPGGPALSEDNRQAIMDAIATRITDEQLAVYGRR